ncbi:flagellar hook-basal body complex protein FliE [Asticcacaulis solisilvae]|uniref:flagellar hook-basal body complex protein FliE n=1 Tax=Asticcacaulis solisilvae TaxID=1217274 RepID=UPI003FD72442
MSTNPLAAIGAVTATDATDALMPSPAQAPSSVHGPSFVQMISDGVDRVGHQSAEADSLVKSFIVNDSVPPHRVIYALEQAQLSLQLMLQVRNRVVEGYQEIMRMQL